MKECMSCDVTGRRLWKVNNHHDDFQYMCGECISFTDQWSLVCDEEEEDEEADV